MMHLLQREIFVQIGLSPLNPRNSDVQIESQTPSIPAGVSPTAVCAPPVAPSDRTKPAASKGIHHFLTIWILPPVASPLESGASRPVESGVKRRGDRVV
jgi:hypothetical protein